MPSHPNLLIDTSWWNPADLIALFRLVPPGQILWASDSPYVQPLPSAAMHLRYAVEAGLGDEALRSIAGAQMERILARDELLRPPGPAAEPAPLDPLLERVVSHLVSAVGVAVAGGDPDEQLALATLACAVEAGPTSSCVPRSRGSSTERGRTFRSPTGCGFFTGARLIALAIAIARTPNTARPAIAPSRRLGRDEAG